MEDRYYYSVSINFIDHLEFKEVVMAKAVDDYFSNKDFFPYK